MATNPKKVINKKPVIATDAPGIADSIVKLVAAGAQADLSKLQFDFLTEKENAFLREYLSNGRKAFDAHKVAYPNKMTDTVRTAAAYNKLNSAAFITALGKIEREAQAISVVTLEDHVRRLRELGEEARKYRQYSAAITAETNCGKASGIYITRTEITGKNGAPLATHEVSKEEYKAARAEILKDI